MSKPIILHLLPISIILTSLFHCQAPQNKEKQSLYPVELPEIATKKDITKEMENKNLYYHFDVGYLKSSDSIALKIDGIDYSYSKKYVQKHLLLNSEKSLYPISSLSIQKNTPYGYIDKLFCWLREVGQRNIFLMLEQPLDSFNKSLGITHILAPVDDSLNTYKDNMLAPPPAPPKKFLWKPIFSPGEENLAKIFVDASNQLFFNNKLLDNKAVLVKLLNKQLSRNNHKDIYVWVDIDKDAHYENFIYCLFYIKQSFRDSRNILSQQAYQKAFSDLSKTEKKEISQSLALQLLIPSKKELNFYENLYKKDSLNLYIQQHYE